MKTFTSILLAITLATSSVACTDNTEYGECLGIDDEDRRDPNLVYDMSTWNVVVGVLFFSTVIVPVWVALDETYCPVGRKNPQETKTVYIQVAPAPVPVTVTTDAGL